MAERMEIKVKPKKPAAEEIESISQLRRAESRYRLQVDRQTKSSFENFDDAEKAGLIIKEAHPIVQVSVYDAQSGATKIIEVAS